MNTFALLYKTLQDVIAASPEIRELADVVTPVQGTSEATDRRSREEAEKIRIALVPMPGGTVNNLSSSHTRLSEKFLISSVSGYISHADIMALKWAVVAMIWRQRTLGLAFVEKVDVDTVTRRSDVGTAVLGSHEVTWALELVITAWMILDRTDLPMS